VPHLFHQQTKDLLVGSNKMNSTTEIKKVDLVLDENQLCTLITMAQVGLNVMNDGHSRTDKREIMSILRDALYHLI
jgi:hypothetical protein